MSIRTYRAVSVGALGGIAAFLALGPAAPFGVRLFAVLLGWAGYYHFGGKLDGLKKATIHYVFGALLAALALVASARLPYGDAVGVIAGGAIVAAIALGLLVLATKLPALSDATASLIAFATVSASASEETIIALTPDNPALLALASLIVGAIFALGADYLAEALRKYIPLPGQKAPSAASP